MKIVCFSSFTFSYLDRARILYRSLRRWHPDWRLVALITDALPAGIAFDPSAEPFDELVYVDAIGIDDLPRWLFLHDVVEACTAVKGPFLSLLCSSGADAVIYLDPDTVVFNSLDPVVSLLEVHDIVLTPHQLAPDKEPAAIQDNEITSLATGIYNLGFLAVACRGEGLRFAEWWRDRLLRFCYDDIARGVFVDQRWCDHIPSFFDRVCILKDPGYNVASWNLSHRHVAVDGAGMLTVNGAPLRFWHFTKLGPLGDTMTRRYAGANYQVYELWNWYREQVARSALSGLPARYWRYGVFADGAPVARDHRLLFRRRSDLWTEFPDPFASGSGSYQAWLKDNG